MYKLLHIPTGSYWSSSYDRLNDLLRERERWKTNKILLNHNVNIFWFVGGNDKLCISVIEEEFEIIEVEDV